jgi:hypothetical protein
MHYQAKHCVLKTEKCSGGKHCKERLAVLLWFYDWRVGKTYGYRESR